MYQGSERLVNAITHAQLVFDRVLLLALSPTGFQSHILVDFGTEKELIETYRRPEAYAVPSCALFQLFHALGSDIHCCPLVICITTENTSIYKLLNQHQNYYNTYYVA